MATGRDPAGGRAGATNFRFGRTSVLRWVGANGGNEAPEIDELLRSRDEDLPAIRHTRSGGRDGTEVILIAIVGGGHTWPGQPPRLATLAPSTLGIAASDLMWDSYERHARRQTVDSGS